MTSANTPISDAKALELQRILVLQEMQDEIISWAKKRFAMLGLAAAVLGFFGLSTVLNQSLQILVTKPVERELVKLDDAKERASAVIAELAVLSSDVEQKGHQAQEAAEAATRKIGELEANIKTAARNAKDILDKYDHISGGMSRVAGDIFSLASSIREEEKRLRIEIEKSSAALSAIQGLNTAIARSFGTTQVSSAVGDFEAKMDAINAHYLQSLDRLARIKTFNIVFYIRRNEDDQMAQAAVRHLLGQGYRAAVWYAEDGEREAAIQEIAGEFGDIADILQAHPSGIVSHPLHEDIAVEIGDLLATDVQAASFDAKVYTRPLQPAPQHLSHDRGRKAFEADRVILIYSLGPTTA
ncbi:MAG TPA: hypothetical protein VIR45_13680 [Kiloniellaceae bacterium]